jgi:hypothetical protein
MTGKARIARRIFTLTVATLADVKPAQQDPQRPRFAQHQRAGASSESDRECESGAKAESLAMENFTSLWAGQAAYLGRELPAAELTRQSLPKASPN